MRAMVVKTAGEPFVLEQRGVPQPGRGQVRIRVHACGVCHSDKYAHDALWPGMSLPRVPGHEVAGVVDAVGEGVARFAIGDQVGVGWHGGHDGTCRACLDGLMGHCEAHAITGLTQDGGYAEHMLAPEVACAPIPDGMDMAEAGPMLCAGVTTFNALRNSGARPGDLVGVQGLGGLGHLGVQFARAMGHEVVAISRGADKEEFARQLGAHHYVDAAAGDVGATITKLGGARVILATAPHAASISALVPALRLEGSLVVVGAPFEPLTVSALDLISRRARVQGWASGTAADSADTMRFAQMHGVKPMIERFPLADANAAYDHMMSGAARFRVVLDLV